MAESSAEPQVGRPGGTIALDVYVLSQRIGALLDAALAPVEITPAEYAVYGQLGQRSLTPKEIAGLLGLKASTLSGYLGAMQRRGHARRVPREGDRRSYQVELTSSGRDCLEKSRPLFRRALGSVVHHLDRDVEEVRRTLAEIDAAVSKALADTEPGSPDHRPHA